MKLIEKAKGFLRDLIRRIDFRAELVTPLQWLTILGVMIVIRMLIIDVSSGFHGKEGSFLLAFFFQEIFFFLNTLLLIWIWLSLFLRLKPEKLFDLMLWGTWLVLLPPIIDLVFYQKIFWSFYLFGDLKLLGLQYVSFFGHLPPAIVYFGTKIAALAAVVSTSVFVYYRTNKLWKAILNGVIIYSIFFFMASFPSWLTFLHHIIADNRTIFSISAPDVAAFIISPVDIFGIKYEFISSVLMFKLNFVFFVWAILLGLILWLISAKEGLVLFLKGAVKNEQLFINEVLFLFGFGVMGVAIYPKNFGFNFFAGFTLIVLMLSLWISLVADQSFIKQKKGNVDKNDNSIAFTNLLNVLALSGFLLAGVKFFMLVLVYKLVLWVFWSSPFIVFKKKIIKYGLDWIMCIVSIALGFMLMSQDQALDYFPTKIIAWACLGIVAIFSIKNNKSGEEPKKASDIFSEANQKIAQEVFVFALFMAGVFILQKPDLFSWALIFGGASFWTIEKEYQQRKWLLRVLFLVYLCLGVIIL